VCNFIAAMLLLLMCYVHKLPGDISIPAVRQLLGAFTKLRKAAISLPVSIRPKNSAPTGRIFYKFDTLYFSQICRENWKFRQNQTIITGTLHETCVYLLYLSKLFLE
jgi:hypothetical protein